MSFCHPASVDRDALREQQRQARLAQFADIKDEKPQLGLFGEPIKVSPSSDDPLGKKIKKTLGEYHVMKETISQNPKNLIGITRQPATPGPNTKVHHEPPTFPSNRPPHHNGQSRTNLNASASSRSTVHRDSDSRHDRVRPNEFVRPKAVSSSSSAPSASSPSKPSCLLPTLDSSLPSTIKSESQQQQQQQHNHSVAVKRETTASPVRERISREQPRERTSLTGGAHHQHQNSNHYHHSSKNQPNSEPHHRRSNGLVLNGGVKHGGSQDSSAAKPNLRLKIENQVKPTQDSAEVEDILNEMIAPTPLSGIPTPRKQPPDSKFPFPTAANQADGHTSSSSSSHSKTKLASCRTLDLTSVDKVTPASAAPPHSAGILKEDLAISDSDDDLCYIVRKGSNGFTNARPSGSAVLTNPPPPLAAMSPNSDSSSSESEGSTSGSDTEENSNKSHESETSDVESRPESPKPDQIWNLDNFIKSSSQPVPFGLPSDSLANLDLDDSQNYETRLCRHIKNNDTGGFNYSVPEILSDDFTKEDIKILIPSPPPVSRESFDNFSKGNDGRNAFLLDDDDDEVISRKRLPVPASPSRPQSQKKNKHVTASIEVRPQTTSSSSLTASSKDKLKKYSSSKHVKDIFVKKNGLLSAAKGSSARSKVSVNEDSDKRTKSPSVSVTKQAYFTPHGVSSKKPTGSSKTSSSKKLISECSKGDADVVSSKKSSASPSCSAVPSVVVTSPVRSSSSVARPTAVKSEKHSSKGKEAGTSSGLLPPPPSRHIKKSGQKKPTKAQLSQKLFKSKEYISDTGDSSDSESEIVDVVGTPSPIKVSRKPAALSSSLKSSDVIGTSSKPVSPFVPPLVQRSKSSKSHSSKTKETVNKLTEEDSHKKRISSALFSSSSSSSSSSSEDLSTKTVPLSPIRDRSPSSSSSSSNRRLQHSSAQSVSTPSLVVHLDISLLERVPPYPPTFGRLHDAPSQSKGPIKKNGSIISASKKPAVIDDRNLPTDNKKNNSSMKADNSGLSSKRRNSNTVGSQNVEKKRKIKPSKGDSGSTSSLSSTASSSKGPHKSRSSGEIGDKVLHYVNGGLNKDKNASIEQRVSDFSPGRTERKVEKTTKSVSSKKDILADASSESERVLLDVPISSRMPREREIQLPTRDEPPPPPLLPLLPPPPQQMPSISSVGSAEYESRVVGDRDGARSRSPDSEDLVRGNVTPSFESRSPLNSQGPSGSQCNTLESTVTDKDKYLIKKERCEPEFKRRKGDATVSSQSCSKWEPPKMSGIDGIERSTNHDRIPVARVRPNTDFISNPKRKFIELNERLSSPYYLEEAKKLKHEADKETDRTRQSMLYLEAILYFILTGEAMEREQSKDMSIYQMFCQSVDLIKHVASNNKFRHQTVGLLINEAICTRLSVLSLRCQSLLHLKLFNMKKKEFHECQRFLTDHQKSSSSRSSMTSPHQVNGGSSLTTSLWSGKSGMTGTSSPMSPLPSPAGSVGSVESQSSGYSSPKMHGGSQHPASNANAKAASALAVQGLLQPQSHPQATITVPAQLHSVMLQQLSNYQHLSSCHEMWEQADIATVRGRSEEFFATLDQQFGKLTLHCSLRELVRYVQHGLYLLKGNS